MWGHFACVPPQPPAAGDTSLPKPSAAFPGFVNPDGLLVSKDGSRRDRASSQHGLGASADHCPPPQAAEPRHRARCGAQYGLSLGQGACHWLFSVGHRVWIPVRMGSDHTCICLFPFYLGVNKPRAGAARHAGVPPGLAACLPKLWPRKG